MHERHRRASEGDTGTRPAPPPPTSAMDHRGGPDQEMRPAKDHVPAQHRPGGKAPSTARDAMKSMRGKPGYAQKAMKTIRRSLASGTKKAQTVISKQTRGTSRMDEDRDGAWDDGHVGTWATGDAMRVDYPGDVDGDTIMGDSAMEFDRRSYPPLSAPQNMNVMAQQWGGSLPDIEQMAVSEWSSSSSSASVFSEPGSESRCSSPGTTGQAGVCHLEEEPRPATGEAPPGPLWVELHQGFDTRGERLCWAPATLKGRGGPKGQRQVAVPRRVLHQLEQYDLPVETNPHWLSKGLRLEKVVPYRNEFQGPAALLVVTREHDRKAGSPFHFNVRGPTRVGKVSTRPPIHTAVEELADLNLED